jgi:hypothetical protein
MIGLNKQEYGGTDMISGPSPFIAIKFIIGGILIGGVILWTKIKSWLS